LEYSAYWMAQEIDSVGMKIETLHGIFHGKNPGHTLEYQGKCCVCAKETIVSITKTSSGYGFIGGVIHDFEAPNFIIKCDVCFHQGSKKTA